MKTKSPLFLHSLKLLSLFVLFASNAFAAIFTNAVDGNWNAAANWSPNGVPTAGTALVFGTNGSILNLTNNLPTTPVSAAAPFTSGAITISNAVSIYGNDFTNGGSITYSANGPTGTATFNNNMVFTNSVVVTANSSRHLVFNGVLSGPGGISRNGANGQLTLNGLNTFIGAFTNQGTVTFINSLANAGQPQSLGAGTGVNGVIVMGNAGNFGQLTYDGGIPGPAKTDRQIQIGFGTVTNMGGATFVNNGTNAVLFTNANFNVPYSAATTNRILTLGGTSEGTNEIKGVITDNNLAGGGTIALFKTAAGSWILSGANTYSGPTTNNFGGGMLRLNNVFAIPGGVGASGGSNVLVLNGGAMLGLGADDFKRPLGTGAGQVHITSGGSFAAYGADRVVNFGGASAQVVWGVGSFIPSGSWLNLGADAATHGVASDKTVDFQNPIDLNGADHTVNVANGTASVDGLISGAITGIGGLIKTGDGQLTLSGTNTFSGDLTAGGAGNSILIVSKDENLGSGGYVHVQANTTFKTTAGFTTSKNFDLIGSGSIIYVSAGNLVINGIVTNSATAASEINGAGMVVLNNGANNFYNRVMLLQGSGSLGVGHASALNGMILKYNGGTGLANCSGGNLALASGFQGLILTSGFQYFGTNDLDISVADSGFTQTANSIRTITVNQNRLTIGGIKTTGTDAAGTARVDGGLTKAGTGTLVIAGNASEYTKGTLVNGGSLLVNGAGTLGSGTVTNNATLGGTGTIAGGVTNNPGATISSGDGGAGGLTVNGELMLLGSGTLLCHITNGIGTNTLVVNGALTSSGVTTVSIPNAVNLANGNYTLIDVPGALNSSAGNFDVSASTPVGKIFTIACQTSPNKVVLTVADSGGALLTWAGQGANWDINTSDNWSNTVPALVKYNDGDSVTFDNTGLAQPAVNLSAAVAPLTLVVSNTTGTYSLSGSGKVTGGTGLTKNGGGALTVATGNDYSGATVLNAGTLNINHASAISTNTLTIAGGTVDNTSAGAVVNAGNNNQNWNGDFAFTGTKDLDLGSGTVVMSASRSVTVNAGNLAVGGAIVGSSLSLTKNGNGTLTLSGANAFTGNLTNLQGTLSIPTINNASTAGPLGNNANAVVLGSGGNTATLKYTGGSAGTTKKFTTAAGGTAVFNVTNVSTILTNSGVIDGSGNITKTGPGTLMLNAANTFTGDLALNAGTLFAWNTGSSTAILGAGTLTLNAGELRMGSSGGRNYGRNTTIAGNVALTSDTSDGVGRTYTLGTLTVGGQTVTVQNTNGTSGSAVVAFGNSTSTGATTFLVNSNGLGATMQLTLATLTNSAANVTIDGTGNTTISGAVGGGSGGLIKNGSGILTLPGTNTFGGGVTLNAGTLRVNSPYALGDAAGTLTITGGSLDNTSGGSLTLTNYPQAWNGDFTYIGTQNLNLGMGAVTPNADRIVTVNASTLTVGGPIGGGNVSLTKAGPGELMLTGTNTYTGNTVVNVGTLTLNSPQVGDLQAGNDIVDNDIFKVTTATSLNQTLTNNITGTGKVTKAGAGTLTLTGSNSGTTLTTVSAGTLVLGRVGGTIPDASQVTVGGVGATLDVANDDTVDYVSTWGDHNAIIGVGTLTFNSLTNSVGSPGTNYYTAKLAGPGHITKQFGATMEISGANSYSGGTYVLSGGGGIIRLGGATPGFCSALGTGPLYVNAALTLSSDGATSTRRIITNAVLLAANLTMSVNTLGYNGGLDLQGPLDLSGATRTITINNTNNDSAISGEISNGGLIKAGTGSLILSGASTYVGATTNNAGMLVVNGSLANTAVQVNGGALAGAGTIGGAVTLASGASLSPGYGNVGTLTINSNLTLNTGGILVMEITNTLNADKIVVNGSLSPSGTTTISLTNTATLANGDYTLIESPNALGGTAANFSISSPTPFKTYTVVYQSGSPNKVVLQVTDTPITLTWTGEQTSLWDINTSTNWLDTLNGNVPAAYLDGNWVTFSDLGATNPTVSINTTVSPGNVTVNTSSNYTFVGAGGIAGSTGLSKSGVGVLSLSNANSFSGAVAISGGEIVALNTAALGSTASSVTVAAGATLALANDITVGAKPLSIVGDGLGNLGALQNYSGNNTYGGNIVADTGGSQVRIYSLAGNLLITGNITNFGAGNFVLQGSGNGEIAGVVSGSRTLFKSSSGAGTWILSGANIYDANTTVANGTIQISSEQNLGATPATVQASRLNLTGGTLRTTASLTLSTNRGVNIGVSLTGGGNGGRFNTDTNTILTVNSVIAGTGETNPVVKLGSGTLVLNRVNTYRGDTVVSNGTLLVNGSIATNAIVQSGGTLGGSGTIAGPATFNAGSRAVFTLGSPLTFGNSLTVAGSTDVHLNLSNGVPVGVYTLAVCASSSGSFNSAPVIDSGSLAANTAASIVTTGSAVELHVVLSTLSTTLSLDSSVNPTVYGQLVTFTATVRTNGVAAGNATSNVVFSVAGSPVFTNALTGGQAQYSTSLLGLGTHVVGAQYLGDANYLASTAANTNQVVNVVGTTTNMDLSVSGSTVTLTWPASHLGWVVQSNAVDLASEPDWHNIDSTTNGTSYNATVDPAQPNVFYRLRTP